MAKQGEELILEEGDEDEEEEEEEDESLQGVVDCWLSQFSRALPLILQYLDWNDLGNVRLSCKLFRNCSSNLFWYNLYKKQSPHFTFKYNPQVFWCAYYNKYNHLKAQNKLSTLKEEAEKVIKGYREVSDVCNTMSNIMDILRVRKKFRKSIHEFPEWLIDNTFFSLTSFHDFNYADYHVVEECIISWQLVGRNGLPISFKFNYKCEGDKELCEPSLTIKFSVLFNKIENVNIFENPEKNYKLLLDSLGATEEELPPNKFRHYVKICSWFRIRYFNQKKQSQYFFYEVCEEGDHYSDIWPDYYSKEDSSEEEDKELAVMKFIARRSQKKRY